MSTSTNLRHGTVPQPVSAWTLHQTERPSWPLFLQSSVPLHKQSQQQPINLTPGITELAGPAGSGKTQLALSLCLQCAATQILPSRQQAQLLEPEQQQEEEYFHAIYICMGPSSSLAQTKLATRLEQMALAQQCNQQKSVRPWLSRVWLRMIHNMEEFQELMEHDLPRRFFSSRNGNPTHRVGVLVLDSLANLFRSPQDFDSASSSQYHWIQHRTALFFKLASQLKRWGTDHQLTVLVVNQVTQSMSSNNNNHFSAVQKPQPALGLSWSACTNTSIWLTRFERQTSCEMLRPQHSDGDEMEANILFSASAHEDDHDKSPSSSTHPLIQRRITPDGQSRPRKKAEGASSWQRTIQVRFSPSLPTWSGSFVITPAGPILTA